ncbi:Ada metal-binding domain-containing protein [Flavivirga eckloniae]|uniref:Metal-binding protein n=1 Tax=Flavivirga eckloniae TaxID=1803846 RepID=A0A2K9PV97_9FLAO|nr:Ada metal-binding domain-containing protein [Flavivirga eckloniae]AUP80990.1 metal-binding protein [Flavivirga eckloniae]
MVRHNDISDIDLRRRIKRRKIQLGGNRNLKIYGTLSCSSGKRMKTENRVFFSSEKEAVKHGYRPCGHCMRLQYKNWKHGIV